MFKYYCCTPARKKILEITQKRSHLTPLRSFLKRNKAAQCWRIGHVFWPQNNPLLMMTTGSSTSLSLLRARLQSGQGCEFLHMLVLWVATHGYKFTILQQSLWLFLNGSTSIFGGFPKQEVQLTSTNPSLQQLQKSAKLGKCEPWKCSLDGWGCDILCKETLFVVFFQRRNGK